MTANFKDLARIGIALSAERDINKLLEMVVDGEEGAEAVTQNLTN